MSGGHITHNGLDILRNLQDTNNIKTRINNSMQNLLDLTFYKGLGAIIILYTRFNNYWEYSKMLKVSQNNIVLAALLVARFYA